MESLLNVNETFLSLVETRHLAALVTSGMQQVALLESILICS